MGARVLNEINKNNLSRNGERDTNVVRGNRPIPSPKYYVMVEGPTEAYYLLFLKEHSILKFAIECFGDGTSHKNGIVPIDGILCMNGGNYYDDMGNELNKLTTSNLVTNTLNKVAENIERIPSMRPNIVCVFDLDKCIHKHKDSGAKVYFSFYKKLLQFSKINGVVLCSNMPSIEYWFLLHFDDFDVHFYNFPDEKEKFNNDIKKFIPEYKKGKEFWNNNTNQFWIRDGLNKAIQRSKSEEIVNHPNRLDKVKKYTDCNISYSDMYKLFEIQ